MDKFTTHVGRAVPMRRSNVDTDQIIPAVYLKRVTKTGFEDGLFAAWRNDPDFVLNKPEYDGGNVLFVGPDFGTGSSREHAVWALENYGFRVIVGSRFGDIFRSNAGKAGLLVVALPIETVSAFTDAVEADPSAEITVDLEKRSISGAGLEADFEIDDYTRWRLMEGLDDIGLTLRHEKDITSYEESRAAFKPKTLPVRVSSN